MLKLLGGLCVLLSGVLACRNHLGERRRRRETLTDFLTALRRMGETVRAARTPLPILLASLASDCGPDGEVFFKSAAGPGVGNTCRKSGGPWRRNFLYRRRTAV